MNATVDGVEPPQTTNTGRSQFDDAYIFVVGFFCITVLLIGLTYASYICKRSRSPPLPTIFFGSTAFNEVNNHHQIINLSCGLEEDVLATFPTFVYSDALMPHKGDTANSSACSICLADYKAADVVRLLPECSHLFHVKCVDTWLKVHPTCPLCRSSPFTGSVTHH